jgi:hypothetical protein
VIFVNAMEVSIVLIAKMIPVVHGFVTTIGSVGVIVVIVFFSSAGRRGRFSSEVISLHNIHLSLLDWNNP